nr:MAG TPA: LbetaH [Caudoviricetes sp.]
MENEITSLFGIARIPNTIRAYNKNKMKENRHYELTDETIEFDGHTLHRIRCTEDFLNITKGTLGGFVEGYENLCDEAWVGNEAKVYAGAVVKDRASVQCGACVSNCVVIAERALVEDSASVYGAVWIGGNAAIYDSAVIIQESPWPLIISGYAKIGGNAVIKSDYDYIVFKNWWSSGRYFTWTRSNDMWRVGCFYGTGNELIARAYKDGEVSGIEYERVVKYVEQIKRDSKPSLWQRVKKMLTGK